MSCPQDNQVKYQHRGKVSDPGSAGGIFRAKFFAKPFLLRCRFHVKAYATALKCWMFDFVPVTIIPEA